MADIQDLLKQLLTAVYGKDVRQTIHDCIEQCYADGKAGTIDLTARQNIEKLTADVLEMQESGVTAEVIEAKVSTTIQELIADGTMAGMTLEDGSVTGEKIADGTITKEKLASDIDLELKDGSVTPEKTSFMAYEERLESNSEILDEYPYEIGFFKDSNGTFRAFSGWKCSDYIPYIAGGSVTAYAVYNANNIMMYDADKNALGSYQSITGGSGSVTFIPSELNENVAYIRYCIADNHASGYKITMDVPVRYYSFSDGKNKLISDEEIEALKNYNTSMDFNIQKWKGKKLLFDGNSLTYGLYQDKVWTTMLCELLGATEYNHAMSGSTLIADRTIEEVAYTAVEKIQQLYEEDTDAIIWMGDTNYFGQVNLNDMESLKSWVGNVTDTVTDGKTTWFAKMNEVIDALEEKYPLAPIIFICDPPRNTSLESNITGGQFSFMRDCMKAICEHRRIYFIDLFTTSIFRPWNTTNKEYFCAFNQDAVHFSEVYGKLMVQSIFEFMKSVMIINDL